MPMLQLSETDERFSAILPVSTPSTPPSSPRQEKVDWALQQTPSGDGQAEARGDEMKIQSESKVQGEKGEATLESIQEQLERLTKLLDLPTQLSHVQESLHQISSALQPHETGHVHFERSKATLEISGNSSGSRIIGPKLHEQANGGKPAAPVSGTAERAPQESPPELKCLRGSPGPEKRSSLLYRSLKQHAVEDENDDLAARRTFSSGSKRASLAGTKRASMKMAAEESKKMYSSRSSSSAAILDTAGSPVSRRMSLFGGGQAVSPMQSVDGHAGGPTGDEGSPSAAVAAAIRSAPLIGGSGNSKGRNDRRWSTASDGSDKLGGRRASNMSQISANSNWSAQETPGKFFSLPHVVETMEDQGSHGSPSNDDQDDSQDHGLASQMTKWSLGKAGDRKSEFYRQSLNEVANQSMADLDPDDGAMMRHLMLWPDSKLLACWISVTLATIMLLSFIIPIQLTYRTYPEERATWSALLHVADAVLILDVLINFFMCLQMRDGTIIGDPGYVASQYMRTWLILDLVTAWPFGIFEPSGQGYLAHQLLKMLKACKIPVYLSKLQIAHRSTVLSQLKVFIPLVVLVHIWACLYRHAIESEAEDFGEVVTAATENQRYEHYISDLYFLVMTMTSVGFGDVSPRGVLGRGYAIVLMLFSTVYAGFVVSMTGQSLRSIFDEQMEKQVRDASSFMRRRKVPKDLQRRVEHAIRQQVKQERSLAVAPKLLSKLSPSMQRELSLELLRSVVLRFPMLFGAPHSFVAQLSQTFTWLQAISGDLVVEEGQVIQELVFVIEGRLLMLKPQKLSFKSPQDDDDKLSSNLASLDGSSIEEHRLENGAWFGAECLFSRHTTREFTVVSETDSELAVLMTQDFERIICLYPRLAAKHRKMQKMVESRSLSLEELEYKAPVEEEEASWVFFRWFRASTKG